MKKTDNTDLNAGMRHGRRQLGGYLSFVFGCLFAIATVFASFALFDRTGHFFTELVVALVLLVIAVTLLVIAESFLVPSAREVLARDPRTPVLFLRSFSEDKELTYDTISTGETTTTISAKAEDFLLALNAVGPLVTIAEPNRAARLGLHPHGAYRDYVGEGGWQTRVQELLDHAGMVVLAIGDSPGIEWEIDQVRQRIGAESLLLYLPPRPAAAFTRKGRTKKERAVYEKFKPLIEKHFDLEMPQFNETIYLIGFAADGRAVMAPDAPRGKWFFTEYSRVAKTIRAQLLAVLDVVRPGVDLDHYQIVGRSGLWTRVAVAVSLVLASAALGQVYNIGAFLRTAFLVYAPGMAWTIGWVLLARYFGRAWVWAIPLLLGLGLLSNLLGVAAFHFHWQGTLALIRSDIYGLLITLVNFGQGLLILALGITLLQQRADLPKG